MRASEAALELYRERGAHGPHEGTVFLCCPFCRQRVEKDDTKFKLNVRVSGTAQIRPPGGGLPEPFECSYETAVWNCYRCRARGIDDFSWLRTEVPPSAPPPPEVVAAMAETLPPTGFEPLDLANPEHWAAANYLASGRPAAPGAEPINVLRAAVAAGAGICTGFGSLRKYRGRVIMPCLDPKTREWLGFVGRSYVPNDKIPYLTPPRMPRGQIVWGLEYEALREPGAPVYVVEGYMDGLSIFPYGVAPLGKGIQEAQLDLIADFCRETGRAAIPCLDGDSPEENRALGQRLRRRGVRTPQLIELPVGLDPGKLGWKILDYATAGQ